MNPKIDATILRVYLYIAHSDGIHGYEINDISVPIKFGDKIVIDLSSPNKRVYPLKEEAKGVRLQKT